MNYDLSRTARLLDLAAQTEDSGVIDEMANAIRALESELSAEMDRREKAEIAIKPFAAILDHITSEIDPRSMWRVRQDQEDADFTGREVLAAKAILSAPAQKETESA